MPTIMVTTSKGSKAKLSPNLKETTQLIREFGALKFNAGKRATSKQLYFSLDIEGISKPTNPKSWRLAIYADSGNTEQWHEHYALTSSEVKSLRDYLNKFLRSQKALARAKKKL